MEKIDWKKLRDVSILKILAVKDTGRRKQICCPFHSDDTPSLLIYIDNSYHCFGCEAHGRGAIDFLKECGMEMKEIVKELKEFI